MSSPKRQGSDPSYLTARLQRDAPALADKVLSGEMSAHAAALAIASEKYHFRT